MGDIKSLLIIGLVVVAVMTGVTSFYGSLLGTYDIAIPSANTNITGLNTLDEIEDLSAGISSNIENQPINEQTNVWNTLTGGAYGALNLLFSSTAIFGNMIADLAYVAGIPREYVTIVSAIITAIIIFAILKSLLRWEL